MYRIAGLDGSPNILDSCGEPLVGLCLGISAFFYSVVFKLDLADISKILSLCMELARSDAIYDFVGEC